ncbi:MAG: Eco57I restriction-modification methylase domain-containing protein [Christensenellaceae bacterium]|nr:Eco57I restriction-modification methylase domain-containing protein [Christensenellaceae bacterium]
MELKNLMFKGKESVLHKPDILTCIANLSNDEVFTPPWLANAILDLLPQELFEDINTKFLDPVCKSGVFLREIARRLIKGLALKIPDEQSRRNHIFTKQIFGIAITHLTALMTRRSVYCSKTANGQYSVCETFTSENGNIDYENREHTFKGKKCVYCGANMNEYATGSRENLENHAYKFIHLSEREIEEYEKMKFDVVIGNPPYQLIDGGHRDDGSVNASATPIYNLFVDFAKKIKPHYLSMVIPSRWFSGGKGLDDFRERMLGDRKIKIMHDYLNSHDCFSGVEIKAGVCYFLWDSFNDKPCEIFTHYENGEVVKSIRTLKEDKIEVFIRHEILVSIFHKVSQRNEKSFSDIVSSRKPYGLCTDFFKNEIKYGLPKVFDSKPNCDFLRIHGLLGGKRIIKYIPKDYPLPKGAEKIDKWKIFIPKAYGCGQIGEQIPTPILGTPIDICLETFLEIGLFNTEVEAKNALHYLKTKFFRALVGIVKQTQDNTVESYRAVPIQDFNERWTDEKLYKKYNLNAEEISFIDEMIKAM